MRKRDFLISVAIPLFTGVFASLLTGGGMASFSSMTTPPLTPPVWVPFAGYLNLGVWWLTCQ